MRSLTLALLAGFTFASAASARAQNPLESASQRQPHNFGVVFYGGNGLTDQRGGFHFANAGFHAGRVLTNNYGKGLLRGNFEYAAEVLPYWQAFTPKFQRVSIKQFPGGGYLASAPYTVGGTYTGASITPIILRYNLARPGKIVPWIQAAGGLVWTNHKFPAYGNTDPLNYNANGPNGETSVWNFTPQGGIGMHYFYRRDRSLDFSANGEHISSASLGDRNPGANASVQFSIGYSWWK